MQLRRSVAAIALAVAAAGCAVVPDYTASNTTFGGFPVISYVPQNSRGIVFVFHGTSGSADFATKVETVDMLNHLVADGYGFVSTDSTDRTTKQWNTESLSLTSNLDLARLSRLYASLVASATITTHTPIYAIGMSRGAGFASTFAQAFKNAGYPVSAIAPSHGQIPAAVRNAGGLDVPALFALGVNDATVDNGQVERQVVELAGRGVPTQIYVEPETNLQTARLLRVPNLSTADADAIFAAGVHAGIWNTAGRRLVSIDSEESALNTLPYPATVTNDEKIGVRAEIDVTLAVHQYSATYANQTVAFFDAHR